MINDEIKEPEVTEAPKVEEKEKEQEKSKKDKKQELATLKEENKILAAGIVNSKKEFDELNDKYLRVVAEYDNYRKRAIKEREGIYNDVYADIIKEILPIIDNVVRASQYTEAEKVAEGVQLILNQFDETITKLGITEIEAKGVAFDPLIHNAVMHVEDENYGENEVIEVFQTGYKKADKIIRYAMVKVAN